MQTETTRYRILAIDDEASVHETYQAILGSNNQDFDDGLMELVGLTEVEEVDESPSFILDSAYSGEEGLQCVIKSERQGAPYAVVFLDMRMPPGWDGLKTAEKIREIDPAIRIILITAYMDYELSDIRHRIGKDFIFLSKPVNRDELLQLTTLFSAQWERAYELTKQHKIEILSTNAIPWATEGVPQEREATDERPMQVMLVDPSVAIRNLYENLLLRNTNYDVVCAKNIAEAVKLTEHFTPDLVIVSFSLQEEGIEPLTEQVLNKSGSHESLLVFFAEKSDVKEAAFMAGAIEVLFKDDPTEIFLQRVGAFEKYIAAQKNLRSTIQNKADQYLIAAEDAQQASKAKDEFLASVSHELRTPLTVIIGNSEELLGSELSDSQRRLLHSVEVSARSQLSLINDILDISSIEAGKFKVEEAPYDLRALVDEVHDIFYSRASFAGLEFTTTIQQEFSHQLIGDGHRIGQILINLLGNAIKFTQQGEVILTVWGDNELHFRVEDSGIGISMEAQKQLFQRYEQADETISARFGGTGLGLNISYTLAEQMGGTIEVKSREGKGSCFQLNLPYRASEIKSDYSTMDKSSQLIQPSFSGRVLIAEDTPEIQLVVIRMLEAMGIEVLKANNGREAVESALSNHFDLILMDMQMPVM
ncbi:MAG: response regulator, partial [Gammaproteobacteria bacterium]|nr:response regulator [Gammaproteobacteria bacterium]